MRKLFFLFFISTAIIAQTFGSYPAVTNIAPTDLYVVRQGTPPSTATRKVTWAQWRLALDTAYVRKGIKQSLSNKFSFHDSVSFRGNIFGYGGIDFSNASNLIVPTTLGNGEGSIAYVGDKIAYRNIGGDSDTLHSVFKRNKFYYGSDYLSTSRLSLDGAVKITGRDTAKADYIYSKDGHLWWRKNDSTAVSLDSVIIGAQGDTVRFATNLMGGANKKIPYQFAPDSTVFIDAPTDTNYVLTGAMKWKATSSAIDTTKISYLAKTETYTGAKTFNANITVGKSSLTNGQIDFLNASNLNTLSLYTPAVTSDRDIYFPDAGGTIPLGTGTANELTYWSGTNTIGTLATATYPSLTELSYVKGLTSAVQTQINGKQPQLNGTGFVKASGTTISYDNSTYLTANQTITLGGILSGSGTTSITASAASGYYMPTTTDQSNWNTAYSNTHTHANKAKLDSITVAASRINAIPSSYQTIINGTGFVKASGTTLSYDNSTYLTANQTITLSGDASGSGTTAITVAVSDDSHNHTASTISGLSTADFTSANVSQWTNDSGYLTSSTGVAIAGTQTITGAKTFNANITVGENAPTGLDGQIDFINGTNLNTLSLITPVITADRDIYFPNNSGTLALTSDIPSLTGYATLAGNNTWTGTNTYNVGILFGGVGYLSLPTKPQTTATYIWYRDSRVRYFNGTSALALVDSSDLLLYGKLASANTWMANNQYNAGLLFGATGYLSLPTTPQTTATYLWYRDSRVRYFNGSGARALVDSTDLAGYVSLSGTQTITGAKTFNANITVGKSSTTDGQIDFLNGTNTNTTSLIKPADNGEYDIYLPSGAGTLLLSNGSGASLTSLNATNISSGTLADARLSSNVPLKDGNNSISGNNTLTGSLMFDGEIDINVNADTTITITGENSLLLKNNGVDIPIITLGSPTDGQLLFVTNLSTSADNIWIASTINRDDITATPYLVLQKGESALIRYRSSQSRWYATGF